MNLNIRLYRLAKGMTQKEVSQKVGITVQTLGKYERDISDVTMETLIKICDVISAPPEEIIKDYMKSKEEENN